MCKGGTIAESALYCAACPFRGTRQARRQRHNLSSSTHGCRQTTGYHLSKDVRLRLKIVTASWHCDEMRQFSRPRRAFRHQENDKSILIWRSKIALNLYVYDKKRDYLEWYTVCLMLMALSVQPGLITFILVRRISC